MRVSLRQLDEMVEARRFPADFCAAAGAADSAYEKGDQCGWFESEAGRRADDPADS